jgi:hypothetical protein
LALLVVGSVFLLSLVGRVPSAAEGGPAVLWQFAVVAFHVCGGLLALGAGAAGLWRDAVTGPVTLLAVYLAVGLVFLVIRARLLRTLSVPVFTLLATGFVLGSAVGAYRLTRARNRASV